MSGSITITPAPGCYVIRAGDAVIGSTLRALQLTEGSYPPVIYVPRGDVNMALLARTPKTSYCPWKGDCSYFSVQTPTGHLEDAAWSYEAPKPEMAAIAGYVAFYPDKINIALV
ncbi:MAG: DUF427 domain-containing protein [Paracoccaceae bacterium]